MSIRPGMPRGFSMRILPVSLDAMLVELESLEATLALFDVLQAEPIEGVTELVPAARTILVRFDPSVCRPEGLATRLAGWQGGQRQREAGTLLRLPVRYDGEDLAEVAAHLGLSVDELIRRHAAATWQVAFTGFAPGFAYMTSDDPIFDVPRRASPRTQIPAGSVALAGRFCGIYPRTSPGGWQLLGTTGVPMWDLRRLPPALLQPGGRVQFVDVDTEAGARLAEAWRERTVALHEGAVPTGQGTAIRPAAGPASPSSAPAVSPAQSAPVPAAMSGDTQANLPDGRDQGHVVEHMMPLPAANDPSNGHGASALSGAHPAVFRPADEAFEVLATGLQAIFQDTGREGQASQGVSASGALDRKSYWLANRLVGNHRHAPAIEVLHGGFSLRALSPVVVAVTGVEGPLELRHEDGSRWQAGRHRPLALDPGDTLTLGAPEAGLRSYLAVRGGFRVEPVLGSVATDTLAGIGPEPLRAGQRLSVADAAKGPVMMHEDITPPGLPRLSPGTSATPVWLDMVLGPRTDWFDDESVAMLEQQDWQVTLQSNRVGLRLLGERPLRRAAAFEGVELPSEGTALGALQVPANGQPVLFLADHPLTGGYPVIGCVVPYHLDLAAQLPAGALVRFRIVAPFRPWWPGPDASA